MAQDLVQFPQGAILTTFLPESKTIFKKVIERWDLF